MKVNVEQARKRAKELVKQGAAPTLAQAQLQVARELGYRSWPGMVRLLDAGAERVVREAGERGDRARELLERSPELRDDPWVALSLGDASRIRDSATASGSLDCPPLFYVARSRIAPDTVPAARDLLAHGADPNAPGVEGWSNLSVACSRGDAPLVRLLLDAGAEPNDNDSLYHSVEAPDPACTQLLLERGGRVAGTNALAHALDYDRLERVGLLLEHLDDPVELRGTLQHAVKRGRSAPFVRLLAEQGADVTYRDASGLTAYQHAVRLGHDEVAYALRDLGSPTGLDPADLALRAVATGEGAVSSELDGAAADVMIELALRDVESLRRVVDAVGPSFSARWGGGPRGTLLHQAAAWFGRPDLVELLLRDGADPNAEVETEYATPLGWAAVGSRYSPDHPSDTFSSPDADWVAVATLLVEAGARIEPKDVEMARAPLGPWLAARV